MWKMFVEGVKDDGRGCLGGLEYEEDVNKGGMGRWMEKNGVSVRKGKSVVGECKKWREKEMGGCDWMFVGVRGDFSVSEKERWDML